MVCPGVQCCHPSVACALHCTPATPPSSTPCPAQHSSCCMPTASRRCGWTRPGCARWGRTSLRGTPRRGELRWQGEGVARCLNPRFVFPLILCWEAPARRQRSCRLQPLVPARRAAGGRPRPTPAASGARWSATTLLCCTTPTGGMGDGFVGVIQAVHANAGTGPKWSSPWQWIQLSGGSRLSQCAPACCRAAMRMMWRPRPTAAALTATLRPRGAGTGPRCGEHIMVHGGGTCSTGCHLPCAVGCPGMQRNAHATSLPAALPLCFRALPSATPPAPQVKECFVIDFDADAYMAAAAGPEAVRDFFYSRMVLSEGARVRCSGAGTELGQQVRCSRAAGPCGAVQDCAAARIAGPSRCIDAPASPMQLLANPRLPRLPRLPRRLLLPGVVHADRHWPLQVPDGEAGPVPPPARASGAAAPARAPHPGGERSWRPLGNQWAPPVLAATTAQAAMWPCPSCPASTLLFRSGCAGSWRSGGRSSRRRQRADEMGGGSGGTVPRPMLAASRPQACLWPAGPTVVVTGLKPASAVLHVVKK